jgi:hypothetical protein
VAQIERFAHATAVAICPDLSWSRRSANSRRSILFVLIIFPEHCDEAERVLLNDPSHGEIVQNEALCTSLGSTDIESIQWVPPGGRRRMILRYETPGGIVSHKGVPIKYPITPSVTWLGANDLHIAISAVGSIIEKQDIVGGVRVSYDIGLVIYH